MRSHSTAEPSTIDSGWRSEMLQWCEEFRRFLAGPWRDHDASVLFERIEAFSVLAELIADRAIAEATAELAVYMCAFVDSELHPEVAQRRRLGHLASELEQALLESQDAPAASNIAEVRAAAAPLYRVLYLSPPGMHRADLATSLTHERIEVDPVDQIDAALAALDHSPPDAIIVHADHVPDVKRLAQPTHRHAAAAWRRVPIAAVGMEDDVRARLHARRAGVDVLLDEDPDEAARAMLAALLSSRDQSYRVLVVEDDRGHAAFCESLLRHQGFEVDIAPSAEQALERMQTRAPDLMLLDVNLPDMSGIELCQLVRDRSSFAHVPIVFLTGEEDLDRRAEAIAAGGDDFLSKPVRPRHLLANVKSRIGRARALASAATGNRGDDGIAQRLDRVRFIEALEGARDSGECSAVGMYALDDIAQVAGGLGFVRAGNLALQIAQSMQAECGGIGRTCVTGEFSCLVLLEAESDSALRQRAETIRNNASSRGWMSASEPLRVTFSTGLVRFDGCAVDGDTVIAEAIAMLDHARREGGARVAWLDLR
jgi:DNA-binding response OmpR family regulator